MDSQSRAPFRGLSFTPAFALAVLIMAGGGVAASQLLERNQPQVAVVAGLAAGFVALMVALLGLSLRERQINARARVLLQDIGDVVVLVQDSVVIESHGPVATVLGREPSDVVGLTLGELLPSPELDRVHGAFGHAVGRRDELTALDSLPIARDGTITAPDRWVDLIVRDRTADRSIRAFVLTIRDATARARAELDLVDAAAADPETRLPNRARFVEMIDSEIHRARRTGDHVSVLVVGIDRHSTILDGFQESEVFSILAETASRIRNAVRVEDVVGRVAADQFGVLLGGLTPAIGRAYAVDVADRISTYLQAPFTISGATVDLRASVGAAHRSQGSAEVAPADLLRDAEESLRSVRANSNRWRESVDPSGH